MGEQKPCTQPLLFSCSASGTPNWSSNFTCFTTSIRLAWTLQMCDTCLTDLWLHMIFLDFAFYWEWPMTSAKVVPWSAQSISFNLSEQYFFPWGLIRVISVLRSGSVRFFYFQIRQLQPQLVLDWPIYWVDPTGPSRTSPNRSGCLEKTGPDLFFNVKFIIPI